MMRAVVATRFRLHASPMMPAAGTLAPTAAIITTWSAPSTSCSRCLVRPERSLNQAFIEKRASGCGAAEKADAVRKPAPFQRSCASRSASASLGQSSATTFTTRGCELGASMRKRLSAALLARALSLDIASNRRVGDARTHAERVLAGILEGLVRRKDQRGRTNPLVRDIDARRRHVPFHQALDGAQQAMPGHDDAVVSGDQVLLGTVDDRAHAFLQGRVLHGDTGDAAVRPPRLLRVAVDQV